jgi:hypothetical protein
MKNFKGLHTYAVGGINTEDFAPGNKALTNMITANPSRVPEAISSFGDKKPKKFKQSKKAKKCTPNQKFKDKCFKRN